MVSLELRVTEICRLLPVLVVGFSGLALAQEPNQPPIVLEEIEIVEQLETEGEALKTTQAYESFDPYNTGTSVITEQSITDRNQGGIDTTELLKTLPFVEIDIERYEGSARAEQHLNPSDFSISGGRYYDNAIMVNGVWTKSMMDVTQSQDNQSYDEVNGQSSQTLYLDPEMLEAIAVHDSNVPAEYGGFSGGVVDFQIREAGDSYKVRMGSSLQTDEMVHYLGEDADGDPYPDYIKYKTFINAELPLTEKLKVFTGYSRSESISYYEMDEEYGGNEFDNSDVSENFSLNSSYEINDDLKLSGMFTYSPYTSEFLDDSNAASERVSNSTGLATSLGLTGYHNGIDWSSSVSYNLSDTSRDWDGDRYKWSTDSEYGSTLCDDDSYCFEGGFGDIDQTQEDYSFNLSASHDLGAGSLKSGAQITYTQAYKERTSTNTYYSTYETDDGSYVCGEDDNACMSDIAFTKKTVYEAYEANVEVYQHALWTSYSVDFDAFNLTTGLRYSYDDYLGNHNFAPRLSGSWEFKPDYYLTLGANRYYTSSTVAYAIKEATPATITYRRDVNDDGTLTDWAYSDSGTDYNYSDSDVDTPYSDELTQTITLPGFLDGQFRIKNVLRFHRDGFSTSREYGDEGTYEYEMENNTESDYWGLALEWSGEYQQHKFNANVRWSQTKYNSSSATYWSSVDIDEAQSTYYYYDGEVISEYDLDAIENGNNYDTPIKASINWSTTWWKERLATVAELSYRGAYEQIDDTGDTIDVDGTTYEIYDEVTVNAYTEVNLNSKLLLWKNSYSNAVLDLRITNLFDQNPYSDSSTYQRGRAYWVGATIDFM